MHRVVVASLVLLWSLRGNAQPAQPAQPAPAATAPAPEPPPMATGRLWLGPQLDLMAGGNVTLMAGSNTASADLDNAIGLGGLVEYRVSPLVTVGLAPRFGTPIRLHQATDSGTQLDLRARVTVGKDVAPRVRLHGIATLGYSWIFHVVSETNQMTGAMDYVTTSGIIFGLGAGLYYTLGPRLLLAGELSYQFGRQGTTIANTDVRASDNFLTLGVGLLTTFD
jgi:hypothetical protein